MAVLVEPLDLPTLAFEKGDDVVVQGGIGKTYCAPLPRLGVGGFPEAERACGTEGDAFAICSGFGLLPGAGCEADSVLVWSLLQPADLAAWGVFERFRENACEARACESLVETSLPHSEEG